MLIFFYISMIPILLKFGQAILTRISLPFCLSSSVPVYRSNCFKFNFVKWSSLVVSTFGYKLLFLKIQLRLQPLLSILNTQFPFQIEFDVSCLQLAQRISVPLKSLGKINRSIFSLPVIFAVAVHSVWVARDTRTWFAARPNYSDLY